MTKIQKSILKFLAGNQMAAVSAETIGKSVGKMANQVTDAMPALIGAALVIALVERPRIKAFPALYRISMTGLDYVRSKNLS